MKKKRKRVVGTVLMLEGLALSVIILLLVLKGNISFFIIDAKETVNQEVASEEVSGDKTDHSMDTGNAIEGQSGQLGEDEGTVPNKDLDQTSQEDASEEDKNVEEPDLVTKPQEVYETITISAAGDVTLGRDLEYGYQRSFDHEFELQNGDYGYFFRNVRDIFEKDDLTVVNLETTLTMAETAAEKKFRFKADPSYVEILKQGDIEAVSIANNHTRDYLEQGYQDTIKTLATAEIGYFGYEHKYIEEIRGIQVGLAGLTGWEASEAKKESISKTIRELREKGADLVILMFHWGIERDHYPNHIQKELAHYSIDQGADLVLGSHPHVLQGIEEYNGKHIVYSLGNFSFGGNKNPSDKDTMVYVHKFHFTNGELTGQDHEIIPCSISSVKERNNYQPTPLEGEDKERVLNRIEEYSQYK